MEHRIFLLPFDVWFVTEELIFNWTYHKFHLYGRFMTHTNSTLAKLHPIHCTKERKVQMEFDITTIPAFLLVFAVLWFVLRPRRPKPKINWQTQADACFVHLHNPRCRHQLQFPSFPFGVERKCTCTSHWFRIYLLYFFGVHLLWSCCVEIQCTIVVL